MAIGRIGAAGFAFAVLAAEAGGAAAQTAAAAKERLLGSWVLVSNYVQYQDGSRDNVVGDDPRGMVTYDTAGRFTYVIMGDGRKRFAADNRMQGTDEENRSVMVASLAFYGTYTVEDGGHLTWHVERASFPNWDGTALKVSVTFEGDRMVQVAPAIPSPRGPYVPHTVWQRSK